MQTYTRRAVILIYLSTFPTYVTTGFSGAIEYSWGLFTSSHITHRQNPIPTRQQNIWYKERILVRHKKKNRYKLSQYSITMFNNSVLHNMPKMYYKIHLIVFFIFIIFYIVFFFLWANLGVKNVPYVKVNANTLPAGCENCCYTE